jgi:large subunit ribosomal protein L19
MNLVKGKEKGRKYFFRTSSFYFKKINIFANFLVRNRSNYTKAMNKAEIMKFVEETVIQKNVLPSFKAGDTITVHYKIKEGNKERIQTFQGVVLQRSGMGLNETFTVRKISGNIGVERIFPCTSPFIDKIEVNKHGVVRRARIFYLRGLQGKKARIKEERI